MTDTTQLNLPLIDLASPDADQAARELYKAFREVGFAYVKNHGIPEDLISEAFSWTHKFFSLPQSEKEKAPHPPQGWHHRGYSSLNREKITQMMFDANDLARERQVLDQKESFEVGREGDDEVPNIWPPADFALPGFRNFMNGFYETCSEAAERLLVIVALGLGLPADFLTARHRARQHQLRLLHYPPFPAELRDEGRATCVGPHTDFGTLTMLFQEASDTGGLQVECGPHGCGVFRPAPYVPGTFVVNVADLLMRWSNDELRSTMHRVCTPDDEPSTDSDGVRMTRQRYFIPFFVSSDTATVVDCLPTCHGPDRPKRYEPVIAGEYYKMRLNARY